MSTLELTFLVLGVIIYILIVAIHYSTAISRIDKTGIRGTSWTYLDLIGFILSLPVTIAFCIVAIPFALLFTVAIFIACFTKVDVLVVRIEDWLTKMKVKSTRWFTNLPVVKNLLKPIRKGDK